MDSICCIVMGARNKPCISFFKSTRDRGCGMMAALGISCANDGVGQTRLRRSDASIFSLSAKRRMCCQISSDMVNGRNDASRASRVAVT